MASLRLHRDYILEESVAPRRSPSLKQSLDPVGSPRTISPRAVISDIRPDGGRTSSFRDNGNGIAQIKEEQKVDSIRGLGTISPWTVRSDKKSDGSSTTRSRERGEDTPVAVISEIKPDGRRTISIRENDIGIAQTTDDDNTDSLRDYGTSIAPTTEDGRSTPDGYEAPEPVLHADQIDSESLDSRAPAYPADITKQRGLAPSVASMSTIPRPSQIPGRPSAASKMPEFFSRATFHIILQNATIAHQLLLFGQSRLCGENLEFLARVTRYQALLGDVSKAIYEIHKDFIATSAPGQINLPENLLVRTNNEMRASLSSTLPALESIFADAQNDIEGLVYSDVYPHFVRYQMSVSAAKALGGNRGKYAGLGDCFVLTDPSKADNPIVYASDGFVKVTGYQRNEIIPRNCRFLQCQATDRAAVGRMKAAIHKREECVELLLNEKKNGEPFWNLLYVTPLYDGHGNLAFFLGGQINCSTTIHSASDVLRVLSQSKDVDDHSTPGVASPQPQLAKPPRSRGILNAFRSNRGAVQPRAPGMENVLLDKLEDMPLKNQMDTFYTAYSNHIIINYSSFLIAFVSGGIVDLLFPIKAKTAYHAQAVGTDIFKFLSNHGSGALSWDFKSAVKGALKMGNPISLECKLCARPYMGFETFVVHWTPLKDEHGAVTWIILTLGNERRA